MDKKDFVAFYGGNSADFLKRKVMFSFLEEEVGLSLGKSSIRPRDKLHSGPESSFFLFLLLLYQIINLWVTISACISKGSVSEEGSGS